MKSTGAALVMLVALASGCGGNGSAERQPNGFDDQGAMPNGMPSSTPTSPSGGPGEQVPGMLSPTPSGSTPNPNASATVDPLPPGTEPPPVAMVAPLPRSTPEAEGVDSAGLLAMVNALETLISEVHSVMVVRHGKVVAEGWWAPYAAQDIHVLYSVTKSFNGTAVGLLAQEGKLTLDDPLLMHFAGMAPAQPSQNLQDMRIRHLLTMSTGHQQDTIDRLRQRTDGQWTRAFFELPVENAPGAPFVYNSGASYMLSALVQRLAESSVSEYLTPRLFEPLGITAPLWGKSSEGVNLGDGGLSLRTEDLAKFGQLYLQGGIWNGVQLLPADWVSAASAKQVSNGNDETNWNAGYGYQFWRNQFGGFRADGSLGQFTFVLPEQDLVVVVTSGTEDLTGIMSIMAQILLPALKPSALPANAAGETALKDRLASLALPVPPGSATSPQAGDVSGRRYVIPQNSQGIQSVQLDVGGPFPVLTVQDADGTHAIGVGMDGWVRGRTGFRKRINELFDTPDQGVAARGAWSDASTFVAALTFNETPYTETLKLRFQGEQVFLDAGYNVRWGNDTEPQLIGTRQ
jgi:CubicO group peptidase (beta-lactamase class C family)